MDQNGITLALKSKEALDNNKINEASKYIEQLLSLYPNEGLPNFLRGRLLYKTGKIQDAIAMFNTAITVDNTFSDAYAYLGYSNVLLGNYNEAFDYLFQSTKLNPHDSSVYCTLALACVFLKKDKEVDTYLKKALLNNPSETMDWSHQFFDNVVKESAILDEKTKLQIKRSIDKLQMLANAINKQNKQ